MKRDMDATIDGLDRLPDIFEADELIITGQKTPEKEKEIPVPTKAEMDSFYADLNKCKTKPIALSLASPYADSFVLTSRTIPTVHDLADPKYQDLDYSELLRVCLETEITLSKDQISQIERDTITQSQGSNFFKHRAGRIGASQSKQASHTNPALPSQSLIQGICYPELNKLSNKAVIHGCEHEEHAIKAYEQIMKDKHVNFRVVKCGVFINEDYPWLHATPDFLCSCDCCGEGCGEVKCPLCIENCDFENYISKSSSCLMKDTTGNFLLKSDHAYYYQTQQQLFTVKKKYCDFVVCAFGASGDTTFFNQRILPDVNHWQSVLPKLTKFWRTCILPEVLGKWYTRKHFLSHDEGNKPSDRDGICYCRRSITEESVLCCNPKCPIRSFHLSCLKIDNIPKTWYCPNCRVLPEFKRLKKAATQQPKTGVPTRVPSPAMSLDSICICKAKPNEGDKLLQCHNECCQNGKLFHLH